MYIIIFLVILAVLVFVHELGHFLTAKWAGIRVDEFAVGFPPRIVKFTKGETKYSIGLIPFGGYVKIYGEDYESEEQTEALKESPDKARSFVGKPWFVQCMVLLAGITFNIVFAWLLLSASFMVGMPAPADYQGSGVVENTITTITSVQPNSPASEAGLAPGDNIISLSAGGVTVQNPTSEATQQFTSNHNGQPITVNYLHGQETKTVTVTPSVREGSDRATIGITMEAIGTLRLGFFPAIWEGLKLTVNLVVATAVGITQFLGTAIMGQAKMGDVTGPVGIAGLVNDATQLGFSYVLSFTAFISINLAIINLVPFPALDGGRVLFVLIEKIRGKALNAKAVQIVNAACLGLLLLLMVVITYHDIARLF
jgi:regulator of sigma E protease